MGPESTRIIKYSHPGIKQSIAFVSDLHLDQCAKLRNEPPCDDACLADAFVDYLKSRHAKDIVLLGGDCFSNPKKSLALFHQIEAEGIRGFFVLGNHELRMRGKTIDEAIGWYREKTISHKHFRMLETGKKYYIDGLCFIGDTGWTSFRHQKETLKPKEAIGHLDLVSYLSDFNVERVLEKHKEWVEFANATIKSESLVVALTHFPMRASWGPRVEDFKGCSTQSSDTDLISEETYWLIYGHSHVAQERIGNHACRQYYGNRVANGRSFENQLGILAPKADTKEIVEKAAEKMIERCYAGLGKSAKGVGYRRTGANMNVAIEYAGNREEFLKTVRSEIEATRSKEIGGLTLLEGVPEEQTALAEAAYSLLEEPNYLYEGDARAFFIALIICGYYYNKLPTMLSEMRAIDDADIARFALALLTRMRFEIPNNFHRSITANKSKGYFLVCGEKVYLPQIDGKTLSKEDVLSVKPIASLVDEASIKSLPDPKRKAKIPITTQIQKEIREGRPEAELRKEYGAKETTKAKYRNRVEEIGLEKFLEEFKGENLSEIIRVSKMIGLYPWFTEASGMYLRENSIGLAKKTTLQCRRQWIVVGVADANDQKMSATIEIEYQGDGNRPGTCPFELRPREIADRTNEAKSYEKLSDKQRELVESKLVLNRAIAALRGLASEILSNDQSPLVQWAVGRAQEYPFEEECVRHGLSKGERKIAYREFWTLGRIARGEYTTEIAAEIERRLGI